LDKPTIVDNSKQDDNVISFNKKEDGTENGEAKEFTIDDFLSNIEKNKEGIDNFFFLGLNKDGNSVVSAKADNNLHLHWMLKRFITHLETHLYG
jgi:hypothetical protein